MSITQEMQTVHREEAKMGHQLKVLHQLEKDDCCQYCGNPLPEQFRRVHTHKLSSGLVRTLVKFSRGIRAAGRNDVHFITDMQEPFMRLGHTELSNFQKLRFFALVAKVLDRKGAHTPGHWLLTHRGAQFLRNEVAVQAWVKTCRNEVRHDLEGGEVPRVWFKDFRNKLPEFQDRFEYEVIDGDVLRYSPRQATLL